MVKRIEYTQEHGYLLKEMILKLFPEYTEVNINGGWLYLNRNFVPLDTIPIFEFCMAHLAEKIIATYITNKNGDKIYRRTLNDDLSKFYLESLSFTIGFNKNHPIDYLYSKFKKLN